MRGFSDEERQRIEEALVETARDLFTRYGFQKTTVQDITDPVGIAESTFYRFFDSKSEIYLRALIREQDEMIDVVEAELEGVVDPETQLDLLLRTWIREFERHPLLVESHRDPQELALTLNEEELVDAKELVAVRMFPVIEEIQASSDGWLSEVEPAMVFELLSVLELVATQQEAHDSIGWSGYDAFTELLLTVLKRGLLSE